VISRDKIGLRKATPKDAPMIARIWHLGWRDGHLGNVSRELIVARHEDSFRTRAPQRVNDTTVAVIHGEIVGFVMVVGTKSNSSTSRRGIEAKARPTCSWRRRKTDQSRRPLEGVARSGGRECEGTKVLRASGLD
jgi:hypothetical protein